MNVNYEVYGSPDIWDRSSTNSLATTDFATISGNNSSGIYYRNSIAEGVYQNVINSENEELDDSISPWKINNKSIIFNPKIPLTGNSYQNIFEDELKLFLMKEYNIADINAGKNYNGQNIPYNFDKYYSFGVNKNDFLNLRGNTDFFDGYSSDQQDYIPIIDFNYKDIILLGRLTVSNGTEYKYPTIDEYYSNNELQNNYPLIQSVNFDIYLKNTTENSYNLYTKLRFINGGKVNTSPIPVSSGYFELTQMDGYHVYKNTPYQNNYTSSKEFKLSYNESLDNFQQYVYCVNADERFTITSTNNGYYNTFANRVNFTKNDALKEIAYLGFWFTDSSQGINDANNNLFGTSNKLYLSVIDDTNTTTGEFKSGNEAKELPNYNYGNMSDVVVKSDKDFGNLTTPVYGAILDGLKHYWVTWGNFHELMNFLNSSELENVDFFGKNPCDYIQNITAYLKPPLPPESSNPINIIIRGIDTNVQGYPVKAYAGSHATFTQPITPYFNDFRDYAPYTKMMLYTFLGSVELDNEIFLNHTLRVEIYPDILTGFWNIFIKRDELLVDVLSGKYGAKISLLAEQTGSYQNTIAMLESAKNMNQLNYQQGVFSNLLNTANNFSLGGIMGNASNLLFNSLKQNEQETQLNYTLSHTPPQTKNIGNIGSYNNLVLPFTPKILISRPKMLKYDKKIYAHNIGHACNANGIVSDFKGYTVCANINCDNINATLQEINMIKSICCNGFYI